MILRDIARARENIQKSLAGVSTRALTSWLPATIFSCGAELCCEHFVDGVASYFLSQRRCVRRAALCTTSIAPSDQEHRCYQSAFCLLALKLNCIWDKNSSAAFLYFFS